jgi:hypothetical protein
LDDDPIPLYDGPPIGKTVPPEVGATGSPDAADAKSAVRSRRRGARRDCERTVVCFVHTGVDGRIDHAECPVINISKLGMALLYDRFVARGTRATVQFRTVSLSPVRVTACVRNCMPSGGECYRLGLQFDRPLAAEEMRPARCLPGRDVAPGIRARRWAGLCESERAGESPDEENARPDEFTPG